MFIKRFFYALVLALFVSGCVQQNAGWNSQYGTESAGAPENIQGVAYYPEYNMYGDQENTYAPIQQSKNVAVILPLSGPNSGIGTSISKSIQLAFLQKNYQDITVTFNDSETADIQTLIATNPNIIIGPVFGRDTQKLRDSKPSDLPVLSFSSDSNAIGRGVMTVALMPTQSVEAIMKEIAVDNTKRILILAPETDSGEIMAGAAIQSANTYDVSIAGMYYYTEHNQDSIKETARNVSAFDARSGANTRAREILSDILIKENLTPTEKSSVNSQLDKISKTETLGDVPYDAVLFLGDADDSKALASFLRYFNVGINDVRFYGTALWDNSTIASDLSMSDAKFASLPPMSDNFIKLYEKTYGIAPTRIDSFGFDAANLTIGMLLSQKEPAAYLLAPSGYNGIDGLIRLRPNGENQRAMQISKLDGSGITKVVKPAETDFSKSAYKLDSTRIGRGYQIGLTGISINPNDFIKIPENLKLKYRSKTYGLNTKIAEPVSEISNPETVVILPEDDSAVIPDPEFKPTNLETVDKKYIDSIEVAE